MIVRRVIIITVINKDVAIAVFHVVVITLQCPGVSTTGLIFYRHGCANNNFPEITHYRYYIGVVHFVEINSKKDNISKVLVGGF